MKKRILHGDALAILKTLPAGTFHGCFCDPPYGLSFMGKGWDHGVPPVEVWAEVLRVLKPGAPLLAFGGTRTYHRLACAIEDAGFAISDTLSWLHGQGFPKGRAQLKPAWEPITLAWKKGARVLAIDAARIPANGETFHRPVNHTGLHEGWDRPWRHDEAALLRERERRDITEAKAESLGRWPANLLLDEESAGLLDAQSGELTSGANPTRRRAHKTKDIFAAFQGQRECVAARGANSGGASRFFYCAKASRKERGEGNTHPTVKPLKLCEYLARLILPADPDAHLLVPFAGSGSEVVAAARAGWKRITGIEREAEYVGIARRRMTAA